MRIGDELQIQIATADQARSASHAESAPAERARTDLTATPVRPGATRRMAKCSQKSRLENWEVSIIKAMLDTKRYPNQEILAYFSRPGRSVNQARIVDIKKSRIHKSVKAASPDELSAFLASWPSIDLTTGLQLVSDELLVKAREAMLLAVQAYNSPKTFFRSEVFIVTAMIAWTYLLHAYFKRRRTDYRYVETKDGKKSYATTKHGAPKYWELSKCLEHPDCPLDKPTKSNLSFLIEIRHEIEHQMTQRIDDALSAKLQACCVNFNRVIKELFGERLGLDSVMSVALQFATFGLDQQKAIVAAQTLPAHILAAQKAFEDALSQEEFNDPRYAFRIALVQKTVSNKGTADQVVEFVKSDSEEGKAISRVLLKEIEKKKYKPKQVVREMRKEGFRRFNMHRHTELWQKLDAKNPEKQYGVRLGDGQWYWYESWLKRVREHCLQKNADYT